MKETWAGRLSEDEEKEVRLSLLFMAESRNFEDEVMRGAGEEERMEFICPWVEQMGEPFREKELGGEKVRRRRTLCRSSLV